MALVPYQTKKSKLAGTSYSEVKREALSIFTQIKRRTKRKPYIRSAYFNKQKIFFDYFWQHLMEKSFKDRVRRLKYFAAAVDVLKYSRHSPISQDNPHRSGEILYRFVGLTRDRELFYVQVKEDKRTNKKFFISCFPVN